MSNFIDNFEEKYIPKIGKEGTKEIISKAHKIVEECIDEEGNTKNNVGLIVGKVQSGKTSNFLGIISVAFEKGFDTVILIGGWDNTLLLQNYNRANEVFSSVKGESLFRQSSKVFQTSIFDKPENIRSGAEGSYFNPKTGKKVIVTVLKQQTHFRKVIETIKENKSIFDQRKVLIIDDEGDQASLDGNYTKREKGKDRTKLNSQVLEITKNLKNYAYLTVTATPYANFLLDTQEKLSPKFIKLTKPGRNYSGLQEFHLDEDSNYIELIEDINDDNFEEEKFEMDPPNSLRKAISYFICCIVSAVLNDISLNKYEMLVHIERKTRKQFVIKNQLDKIISEYKDYSENEDDINFWMFKDFINMGFSLLFKRKIDLKLEEDLKFMENFKEVLTEIMIHVINGTKEANKIHEIEDRFVIYIGSDLLQRGVTIENLMVTYITRIANTNNADTVLQRARWFGYRNNILKYIKIFTTSRLKEMYSMIAIMEESLWQELENLDSGEIDTETFLANLLFSIPKSERITRTNVAKIKHVSIKKWQTQNKYLETNNLEWMYFEEIQNTGLEQIYGNSVKTKFLEYDSWNQFSEKSNIDQFLLNKIGVDFSKLSKGNNYNNKKIKVILMRADNDEQKRNLFTEDLKFTLAAAGKRNDDDYLNSKKYYGDSKLHKYLENKDKILIVIYKLKFIKKGDDYGDKQLAYNVYFPGIEVEGYAKG